MTLPPDDLTTPGEPGTPSSQEKDILVRFTICCYRCNESTPIIIQSNNLKQLKDF